jgi:O-antigen/teichoic acid export membrane protein
VFRTAILILSGNATASLLLLVRNLVVARLIPVGDYGIAATFGVVMAMVEMASAFGLQQQIIQSKDGDDPRFQAGLQGFQVLRGIGAGAVLFLIAGPMARFLGIPEVIWAYQILALVPVIKAFEHFDIHRLNRQMRFWPLMLTGGVPALLSLLLIWPLATWLGDWRVMLCAILAQISIMVLTSHVVAERPYKIVFDRAIMGNSLRFGWPILVNSVLLFLVFQGDKLIVGRVLGMEALAIFAMGMTLTLTPTLVIAKSVQNFFLPILSNLDRGTVKGKARFQHMALVATETHMLFGASFVFFIIIFGDTIVNLLLSEKFDSLVAIFTLLAVLQCFRIMKGGPSSVALASGRTENAMIANTTRVLLLPIGYFVAIRTESVAQVISVAIIGEIIGFLVSILLVWWRCRVNFRTIFFPTLGILLMCMVAVYREHITTPAIFFGLILTLFLFSAIMMKGLRLYLFRKRER